MTSNRNSPRTSYSEFRRTDTYRKVAALSDISESIIDDIIGDVHNHESGGKESLAITSLEYAMCWCAILLGKRTDTAYYDAFIRFLNALFEVHIKNPDPASADKDYFVIREFLENCLAIYPECHLLEVLQRDACVKAKSFQYKVFVAAILPEDGTYVPYDVIYGEELGEDALKLLETYIGLGCMFLECDELYNAERMLLQGKDVWKTLPENVKERPEAKALVEDLGEGLARLSSEKQPATGSVTRNT